MVSRLITEHIQDFNKRVEVIENLGNEIGHGNPNAYGKVTKVGKFACFQLSNISPLIKKSTRQTGILDTVQKP